MAKFTDRVVSENVEGGIRRSSPTWCDLCPPSESGECCQPGTERPCYDSGLSPSDRGCYGQASASTSDYWGSPENGTEYVNEGAAASSSERRLSQPRWLAHAQKGELLLEDAWTSVVYSVVLPYRYELFTEYPHIDPTLSNIQDEPGGQYKVDGFTTYWLAQLS
ncbi:hypothetical protein Bbelb_125430 [Branchiostoma belcheri]|nr:hypothetical protein Bbelb_125430 [Branchiostoma belcheri]